ncbi:MAG: F0F1 ATP synthase subunit epsilon [Candidatus Kaiserbacteria bacterium]|nr:MAG: F0F1 ATP synthase subunit epsilon [Candidatus Kaiserbacteria bacterium]
MAEKETLHLVIASVGETRFDGRAASATIPTTAGEITVLPHHEAIVSTLKPGTITVRETSGEQKTFPIDGGVLEVSGNRAVVLL